MGMRANIVTAVKNFASPAAISVSILISVLAIYFAYDGTKSSNAIAMQALETARQANEIALGRIREPSILQFSDDDERKFHFNFTSAAELEREENSFIYFTNDGKKPVEGAVFDVIGIDSLTYSLDAPSIRVENLPSTNLTVTFNSAVQPAGAVRLDVRKFLLQYLKMLADKVPDKNSTYNTVVNVVIVPRALGESIAVGAPTKSSPRDRKLLTIIFKANVIDSDIAKKILSDPYVPHRIYSS